MFYDRFVHICKEHGVTPSRAAIDAGLSKSTVTKWKNEPDAEPSGMALKKLSDYFGITIAELLGERPKNKKPATKGDELKIGPAYLSLAREMQANGIHPDDVKAILEVLERQKNDKG